MMCQNFFEVQLGLLVFQVVVAIFTLIYLFRINK
jgi:hypothetical protein